jgi:hypothetical protein
MRMFFGPNVCHPIAASDFNSSIRPGTIQMHLLKAGSVPKKYSSRNGRQNTYNIKDLMFI